jgi:hypothetical protein
MFQLSVFNQIHTKIIFNSEMGTNKNTGFEDVSIDRNHDQIHPRTGNQIPMTLPFQVILVIHQNTILLPLVTC